MPSFSRTSRLTAFLLICSTGAALGFDSVKWSQATRAGSKAMDSGDWGAAERNFKEALAQFKAPVSSSSSSNSDSAGAAPGAVNDLRFAESLNNLGVLYLGRGQKSKAEPLFEKACKVREKLAPADKETIETESKLAKFFLEAGKREKAQALADKVADYGENEARQFIEVQGAFSKLNSYYGAHSRLESAEIAVKQAEDETMAAIKEQAVETAVVLDSLASSIKDIGSPRALKQTEKLYKSALALRQRTLSGEHAALASSLENLGRLYLAQGRTAQAEPLLKRAYEISESVLGADRSETQLRLDGLASVYAALGRYGDAEALYKKILDGKAKGAHIADIASNMAAMLVKQGRFNEALPYYARALKIQEAANGPQSASLANLLDSYAYALARANKAGEAKKYQARARSIRG